MVTSPDSGPRPGLLSRALRRGWLPLVLVVVLAVSALIVSRLHKIFGSEDLNANAGKGIEIVQFNPKVVVYEISKERLAAVMQDRPALAEELALILSKRFDSERHLAVHGVSPDGRHPTSLTARIRHLFQIQHEG